MHRGRDTNFNFPYGDNNIDNRKEQGQFIDTGQSLLNEPLSKMSNDDGSVRSKNTNDGKTNINQFREEGESDQPPQGPQQPQQFSFQQGQQFGQQQQQQQQQQLPFQYNQPQLSIQQQQQIFQQQQQQQQQQPQLPNRPNINPQTQGQYFNARATSGSEPSSFQYPSLFAASGSSDFGRGLVQQEMMAAQRLSGNSGGYGQQNTQQTPGGGGYGQAAGMGGQGAGYGMGMGQTPMTGGSFNSGAQSQPTPLTGQGGGSGVSSILKASQYGQAGMMDSASSGGGGMGMGDSLLRGNEPLQPTPMVRRGGSLSHEQIQQQMQSMQASQMQGLGQNTPGMNYAGMMNQQQQMPQSEMKGQFPSQHQQQQQQMGQHSQQQHSTGRKRKLEPVEEEDPSMLRYESRPGLDQSPMADNRGALEPEGQCHEVVEKKGIATGQSIGATSAPIRRSSSGQLQDRSGGGTSSSLGQQQDQNIGGSSSAIGAQSSGDGAPLLQEFPFYFDGFAAWVCRHCQHIPPYYRGGNYVWQSATPPPNQYVDSHLRFCPGLNPANVPTQQQVEERQRMQAHMPGQMQGQMQGQQPFGGMQAGMQINQDNSAFPYQMQQQIQQGQNPFMMQQQQQMQQLQQTALQQQQSGGAMQQTVLQQQQSGGAMQQTGLQQHQSGGSLQQAGLQHQQSGGIPQDKLQPMKGQDAPDPPAMTSPLTIQQSLKQDSQGGKTTGDKTPGSNVTAPLIQQSQAVAQHQTSPWNAYPGANERQMFQNQPQYPYQPYPQQMMQQQGVGAGGQYPQHMQPQAVALGSANTLPSPADNPPAKRRKSTGSKISPKGRRTDDVTYKAAIDFLTKKTLEIARPLVQSSDVGQSLIDRTDADLLTDYFFYMMQQLVVCRFSEKDRKTRGGKRENINIGYGGLQCIHCIDAPSARKFFWSTVDRLANSFAEIPSHVLKCKHCPENVKNALLDLKGRHPDQMQMLPRGSQKVFFRRMWRRLHDGDSDAGTPLRDSRPNSAMSNRGVDPPPSEVKVPLKSPKIAAPAAAEFLATSARKESKKREAKVPKSLKDTSPGGTVTIAPSSGRQEESPPSSPETAVLLAIPEDKDWLSDMDCFVRNNIEVFSSKQRDVLHAAADRKYPIKIGQVGIRCLHCAEAAGGARGAAVSYPYSISGIYESVREFQRLHLDNCRNVPDNVREASEKIGSGAASLSSVLRRYYVQAARALGLYDTRDGGIRAGGNPVPMSTAGFQTPASSFRPTSASPAEPMGSMAEDPPETGKKRKAGSSPFAEEQVEESGSQEGEPDSKRRKSLKPEDAPGKAGVSFKEQGDAPARGEVPGKEDAPGEKASAPDGVKEEPPGDSPATQGMPRAA